MQDKGLVVYDEPPKSLIERLTEQFYNWEKRGRGWQVWDYPVELEPPYEPFYHFITPGPVYDDGRVPTLFSSLWEKIRRAFSTSSSSYTTFEYEEPYLEPLPPIPFQEDSELIELNVTLPVDKEITKEESEQFILGLKYFRPISYEVIGLSDSILVQFVCRREDSPQFKKQIQAYFPEALVTEEQNFLLSIWNDEKKTIVVDFGLSNEFMLPLHTFGNFRLDPLIGITGALSNIGQNEVGICCKHCPSKLRAYAGLDRSEKAEGEGWMWYQEVPEMFKCECGKTTMDLQYIRRNLHGLLGHRLRENEQLSFMPLYEKSSLESIRTNFAQLISRNPREELLQKFIDENPILLHQFPAERIIPKPPILTSYLADFGIVTPQKELILVELEKTTTRLMKKDGDIAAPLNHAFGQVRNWLHEVDEHRLAVLDSLKIAREAVSSIRGIVIAGRDIGYDARDLRKLKGADYGRIAFLTYDDLLFAMDVLIRRVETI